MKTKRLECDDDTCILYKNGEVMAKDIWDYIFSYEEKENFNTLFSWDNNSKSYKFNEFEFVVLDI